MATVSNTIKYTPAEAKEVRAFAHKYATLIRTSKASLKGLKAMMEAELNQKLEAHFKSDPKLDYFRAALCRCYWCIERKRTREECLTALSAKEVFYTKVIDVQESKGA